MGYKEHLILAFILTTICCCGLGAFAYVRLRKNSIQRVFVLFSLSVAVWGFFSIAFLVAPTLASSYLFAKIAHLAVVFIPVLFIHYVHSVFDLGKAKKLIESLYLISCIFGLFLITPYFVAGSFIFYDINAHYFIPGPIYAYFLLYFSAVVSYVIVRMFIAMRDATGYRLIQLRYILIGSIIGFVGGSGNFLLAWKITAFPLTPFGTYCVPVFYVLAAYATLKRHVMNMNVLLVKAGVFLALYFFILGIPVFIGTHLQTELVQSFGEDWWSLPFGIFIVSAAGLPYLSLYVSRRAEERVFQDQLRYQKTLKAASEGMTRIRDLNKLLKLITHVITRSVRVTHASIFILDAEHDVYGLRVSRGEKKLPDAFVIVRESPFIDYLLQTKTPVLYEDIELMISESLNGVTLTNTQTALEKVEFYMKNMSASLVVPCYVGNRLFGFLVLGEKLSGQIYTVEDIEVFTALANQAALAIENAFFYEELQVAQAHLFQAEKLATMGQLAGGMAHEIHNPLTIVSGQSQILLDRIKRRNPDELSMEELLDERRKVADVMNSVIKEITRTSEITRRLLKHTKSRVAVAKKDVAVNELLEEVITALAHQEDLAKVDLIKNFAKNIPIVPGHPNQLQEVYLNIMLNAVQLMGEHCPDKGTLEVTTCLVEETVEVLIRDTGPGIPPEKITKLFDPFYTERTGGTGLGLFICQRIMREHQGIIEVESTVGLGTLFRVKLPGKCS